jgi:hypothetical protein
LGTKQILPSRVSSATPVISSVRDELAIQLRRERQAFHEGVPLSAAAALVSPLSIATRIAQNNGPRIAI